MDKTLVRRLYQQFTAQGLTVSVSQSALNGSASHPVYSITCNNTTIWLVSHQMISANKANRDAMFEQLQRIKPLINGDQHHYILLTADHWFNRSMASKQLPAWWLGELPQNLADYFRQGIKLQQCKSSLAEQLLKQFEWTAVTQHIRHPLPHKESNEAARRYMLFTTIISTSNA
ncbi:hypothetical protein [Thaumasiovibrio sp. DFM-14]|uniref:hypothetical protein n=1 Tax=Thaumasiovibrio sp. DFM-14 TaxID=3384792 RepID=UPI0039A2D9D5